LRFARWPPPAGRKGTVVVLQGRAEYIEKFLRPRRDLRARGFAVAMFDWRGRACRTMRWADHHKGPRAPIFRNTHRPRSRHGQVVRPIARRRSSRSAFDGRRDLHSRMP